MLLAIEQGNTNSLFAVHDGEHWIAQWRSATEPSRTADEYAVWLSQLMQMHKLELGLLNACRYGFVDWGISHLVEVQESGLGKAGLQYGVFAVGAVAGSFLTGWATDRYFGGRRAPVISGLMVLLATLTLLYHWAASNSLTATVCLLVLIGFCVFGPQVLLVGTAPADLARRGTPAPSYKAKVDFKTLPKLELPALKDVPYNGLAKTPPMGWNSWNLFADKVDDQTVRTMADAMVVAVFGPMPSASVSTTIFASPVDWVSIRNP